MSSNRNGVDLLSGYPGRCVLVLRPGSGQLSWVYFVTGRSPSSQARQFLQRPTELLVAPTDGKGEHDPLRHYACAVHPGPGSPLVVGNGDHVAHLASELHRGATLDRALTDVDPEPDPPIWTPRIAAVLAHDEASLVAVRRNPDGTTERSMNHVAVERGQVVGVCTYEGEVDQPAGTAPFVEFDAGSPGVSLGERVWDLLDPALRVLVAEGVATSAVPVFVAP